MHLHGNKSLSLVLPFLTATTIYNYLFLIALSSMVVLIHYFVIEISRACAAVCDALKYVTGALISITVPAVN